MKDKRSYTIKLKSIKDVHQLKVAKNFDLSRPIAEEDILDFEPSRGNRVNVTHFLKFTQDLLPIFIVQVKYDIEVTHPKDYAISAKDAMALAKHTLTLTRSLLSKVLREKRGIDISFRLPDDQQIEKMVGTALDSQN